MPMMLVNGAWLAVDIILVLMDAQLGIVVGICRACCAGVLTDRCSTFCPAALALMICASTGRMAASHCRIALGALTDGCVCCSSRMQLRILLRL